MLNRIKHLIRQSKLIFIIDFLRSLNYRLVSDKRYVVKKFRRRLGRELNLNEPKLYNDKIQWMKLFYRQELCSRCADKYLVREYVENKIGSEYLNELIGVYVSVSDIDFNKLPNAFVLKGTHGSSYNIICSDKDRLDMKTSKAMMNRWLHTNYFYESREWVYKELKPRIICEKYLGDESGLNDYKVFCFHGEPRIIQVDMDRFTHHKRNIYNTDWQLLDVEMRYPSDPTIMIPKPEKLEELLDLCRKLSQDFIHVRVDFYVVENKLFFGELTFFHESGLGHFKPEAFELEMGRWIELPKS